MSFPRRIPRATRQQSTSWTSFGLFALLSVLLGVCPEAGRARADEAGPGFRIVAHPQNPTAKLSRQLVANLFLKELTRWDDGEAVRPVDLKADSAVRRRFSEQVLNRSVAAVKSYWQQRIFSGRGVPPPELESEQAVLGYVGKHPGAVGYVSATIPIGNARVIRIE